MGRRPKRRKDDDDQAGPPKRGLAGLLSTVAANGGVIELSQRKLARHSDRAGPPCSGQCASGPILAHWCSTPRRLGHVSHWREQDRKSTSDNWRGLAAALSFSYEKTHEVRID